MIVVLDLVPASQGRTQVKLGDRTLVIGRDAVICAAARILIAERVAQPGDQLTAYRGGMLSMSGPVEDFAGLDVSGSRFRRYREHPQSAAGAPEGAGGTNPAEND